MCQLPQELQHINFQNFKNIPLVHGVSIPKKVGRPTNDSKNEAFSKLVKHIESKAGHIFSIKDLVAFMQQECEENALIENRFLKKSFWITLVTISWL